MSWAAFGGERAPGKSIAPGEGSTGVKRGRASPARGGHSVAQGTRRQDRGSCSPSTGLCLPRRCSLTRFPNHGRDLGVSGFEAGPLRPPSSHRPLRMPIRGDGPVSQEAVQAQAGTANK